MAKLVLECLKNKEINIFHITRFNRNCFKKNFRIVGTFDYLEKFSFKSDRLFRLIGLYETNPFFKVVKQIKFDGR